MKHFLKYLEKVKRRILRKKNFSTVIAITNSTMDINGSINTELRLRALEQALLPRLRHFLLVVLRDDPRPKDGPKVNVANETNA